MHLEVRRAVITGVVIGAMVVWTIAWVAWITQEEAAPKDEWPYYEQRIGAIGDHYLMALLDVDTMDEETTRKVHGALYRVEYYGAHREFHDVHPGEYGCRIIPFAATVMYGDDVVECKRQCSWSDH
jgi:hypothetical protein